MTENILKIMAISLMGNQRSKAYAVFNGEQLVVTAVLPISGTFNSWRQPLIDDIIDKKGKGYVVLIEEKTDLIAQHGTQYLLEDVEGKSNLHDALDWYFALQDMGNLIVPDELRKYLIRSGSEGQRVEKKQDDNGRPYYVIDWNAFHGGYRAVLLCVVAAMTEPISDRFIQAMFGDPLSDPDDLNPVRRWKRLIAEWDIKKGEKLREAREEMARGRNASITVNS